MRFKTTWRASQNTRSGPGLNVEAVSEGPTGVGSELKSVGKQSSKDVVNDIKVVEVQRPSRLAFVVSADGTDFLQEIDLSESGGGTRLQRRLSIDAIQCSRSYSVW